MRSSLCIAAGLFAANIVLVVRAAPTPARPATPAVAIDRPGIVMPLPRGEANPHEAARLQALWLARNAGFHPQPCPHHDPLVVFDADVDPSPGREHMIGNRRFGVAMYAERGELLAMMAPVGCDGSEVGDDQSLSIGFQSPRLIVRARHVLHGSAWNDGHVVERRGDTLVTLTTIDLGGKLLRHPEGAWEAIGRVYMHDDQIVMKYHGRERREGDWVAVDEHCTLTLVDGRFVADDPASRCAAR